MILRIIGHTFHYEMENICRIFFPNEKISLIYDYSGEDSVVAETVLTSDKISVRCLVSDKRSEAECIASSGENSELAMGRLLYKSLSEITGYTPPWGILTGIRPSKLLNKYIADYGKEEAEKIFRDKFLASDDKIQLASSVAKAEEKVIALSKPDSFSLYVSIPFCPSRCSYCSFVSHSISSPAAKKLLPDYLDRLCDELAYTGATARSLGLRLESIYFGGGTPGVLEASQLDRLCTQIEQNFDLSYLREYTVECGRPDTITLPKLRALKFHNVGRISINPQTFSQEVLDIAGRKHTVEQTISAYKLARTVGFDSVNMDLIAGLEGDTVENFCRSVDTAVTLSPENITVHSLALKRSSDMAYNGAEVADGANAALMLEYAQSRLSSSGYNPYYMYRQSKCVGNLENVGWCREGKECLYNVFMMEECHTVLSVGAGAVTRLKEPNGPYIERIFNYKYPYEYNTDFEEMIDRKKRVESFYSEYPVKL